MLLSCILAAMVAAGANLEAFVRPRCQPPSDFVMNIDVFNRLQANHVRDHFDSRPVRDAVYFEFRAAGLAAQLGTETRVHRMAADRHNASVLRNVSGVRLTEVFVPEMSGFIMLAHKKRRLPFARPFPGYFSIHLQDFDRLFTEHISTHAIEVVELPGIKRQRSLDALFKGTVPTSIRRALKPHRSFEPLDVPSALEHPQPGEKLVAHILRLPEVKISKDDPFRVHPLWTITDVASLLYQLCPSWFAFGVAVNDILGLEIQGFPHNREELLFLSVLPLEAIRKGAPYGWVTASPVSDEGHLIPPRRPLFAEQDMLLLYEHDLDVAHRSTAEVFLLVPSPRLRRQVVGSAHWVYNRGVEIGIPSRSVGADDQALHALTMWRRLFKTNAPISVVILDESAE